MFLKALPASFTSFHIDQKQVPDVIFCAEKTKKDRTPVSLTRSPATQGVGGLILLVFSTEQMGQEYLLLFLLLPQLLLPLLLLLLLLLLPLLLPLLLLLLFTTICFMKKSNPAGNFITITSSVTVAITAATTRYN